MEPIQIKPAGRPVLSGTSFWQLTQGGRVIGWASGYQNALAKAEREQQRTGGAHGAG